MVNSRLPLVLRSFATSRQNVALKRSWRVATIETIYDLPFTIY